MKNIKLISLLALAISGVALAAPPPREEPSDKPPTTQTPTIDRDKALEDAKNNPGKVVDLGGGVTVTTAPHDPRIRTDYTFNDFLKVVNKALTQPVTSFFESADDLHAALNNKTPTFDPSDREVLSKVGQVIAMVVGASGGVGAVMVTTGQVAGIASDEVQTKMNSFPLGFRLQGKEVITIEPLGGPRKVSSSGETVNPDGKPITSILKRINGRIGIPLSPVNPPRLPSNLELERLPSYAELPLENLERDLENPDDGPLPSELTDKNNRLFATPTDEVMIRTINPQRGEEFVTLFRGVSKLSIEAMAANGSAGGEPVNVLAVPPTTNEARRQVGRGAFLPEFSTSINTADQFSRGRYLVVARIKAKYLSKGSTTEHGFIANKNAPIEILKTYDRTFGQPERNIPNAS